jgi:hypothetical protein
VIRGPRYGLGTERGERRHQHHHPERQGYPGRLASATVGNVNQGLVPLRRNCRRHRLSRLREGLLRDAEHHRRRKRVRRLVDCTGRIPLDGGKRPRLLDALGRRLSRREAGNRCRQLLIPPRIVAEQGDAEISGGNFLGRWRRQSPGGSPASPTTTGASRRDLNFAEDRSPSTSTLPQPSPGPQPHLGTGLRFVMSRPEQVVETVEWVPTISPTSSTPFAQDESLSCPIVSP